jgi:hypothetical protein
MQESYFQIFQEQQFLTTQNSIGAHPMMCNSFFWPTESFDGYQVPYCFGELKLNQNLNFKHQIRCNYTLEQLNKITFIKIENSSSPLRFL